MRKEDSKTLYSVAGVVIVSLATFIFGLSLGLKQSNGADTITNYRLTGLLQPEEKTEDLDFTLFWNVWDILENHYVDSNVDEKQMFEGAIKGMVSSLEDPATLFYSSEETSEYDRITAGNFEGIGAELGYRNNQVIINSPIKGFPAFDAGVRAGDLIVEIDGVSTEGMDILEAVMKIRGEKGTDVVLKLLSLGESEPHYTTITRGTIHVDSVAWSMKENNVAVIELSRFTEDTLANWMSLWDKTVDEVVAQNPDKLILDLRGNTGGYFDAAIWAASDFLPKGSVVSYQKDRDGNNEVFSVKRDGKLLDIPMIILIDQGSASASEILAGALKHYSRGTIIGEESYGKGTAQQILNLEDGSTLHITTQKWLLPDQSWINHENKITPDIKVEFPREDFEKGLDPQMDKALEEIKSK